MEVQSQPKQVLAQLFECMLFLLNSQPPTGDPIEVLSSKYIKSNMFQLNYDIKKKKEEKKTTEEIWYVPEGVRGEWEREIPRQDLIG